MSLKPEIRFDNNIETGWLIERGQGQNQDPTIWYAGERVYGGWTDQAGVAIRFARKGDAEIVAQMMRLGERDKMWTVVEHAWG